MQRSQAGFSLIELLIVIAIIVVLLSAGIPMYRQQIMAAHELAAIQAIRTIHTAETQYEGQFGKFAQSLLELGPPPSGSNGPGAAGLMGPDLGAGRKSGYIFTLTASPTGYIVNANPESFGSSGRRTFFSDQTMIIRQNWTQEPATDKSPELK